MISSHPARKEYLPFVFNSIVLLNVCGLTILRHIENQTFVFFRCEPAWAVEV